MNRWNNEQKKRDKTTDNDIQTATQKPKDWASQTSLNTGMNYTNISFLSRLVCFGQLCVVYKNNLSICSIKHSYDYVMLI
jgi:hypothetical protein